MINRFSESVRRNQKQWMVVITILAVFSFVFDDLIRNTGNRASMGTLVFLAAFCGGLMSIVGYQRGKATEYGLTGLVVGGLVALIAIRSAGAPVVIRTNAGNFSRNDLELLRSKRQRGEQFLAAALKKIDKAQSAPGFGSADDGSMVMFALLRKEAHRMGVSVSDDSVNSFLARVTQDKLTAKIFNETLREVGMTEPELFDIIRGELEVQLVAKLLSAPADSHPTLAQFTRGMYSGRMARQTPEQLWQSFRKMNVRQALTSVAIPVEEFVKLVPEPSESDLALFFNKYKSTYGNGPEIPGFRVPPKVQLAYLAVSDLDVFEQKVSEITDQDVVDYYLANKERYRVLDLPEPSGSESQLDWDAESPADALQPANAGGEEAAKAEDASDGKKPELSDKPASPEKGAPEKTESDGSQKKEEAKDGAPCDESAEKEKATSEGENSKPEAADAKSEQPVSQPSGQAPPAPALPTDDAPADATSPSLNSLPMPAPAPRYRELDDDLKDQIRETILRDRALAKMSEVADKAMEHMMELSLKHMSVEPKDRDKATAGFAADLKEYAEKHSLEYKETELLSQLDLMNSLDEPIGNATEPMDGKAMTRMPVSVAEEVFALEPSGRGYRLPTFAPRRADTRGARYAYWKIREVADREPELKEVREKVLAAYKYEKARPLAEKRAKELAELVKNGKDNIAAALSGQTINGTPESPAVAVREIPKFTWLRLPESLPQFGLQRPVESIVEGIGQPGEGFMKTVFEDLGNDEVGVAMDSSRRNFYVVRVHDRDGTEGGGDGVRTLAELQNKFSREQFSGFLPTPYEFERAQAQEGVDNRWREAFRKRYDINVERNVTDGPEPD